MNSSILSVRVFRLVLVISMVLVNLACEVSDQETTGAQRLPNIIYIIADDAGYGDFSVNGQQHFSTPSIDLLAAEGIRFTQHYAGSTVCAPSRSSLMTGQHTGHTYIRGNKEVLPEGQEPLPDSIFTLAEMLQQSGYVTGAFGKWGLGYPGSEGDPLNQGFNRFFGYNCQRLAHNYYPANLWDNDRKVELTGNTGQGMETYSADLIHEQALEFIEENKDRPFFLFLPYTIPHAELLVPEDSILERFKGRFSETPFEGTDYGEENFRLGPYGSQPAPRATFAAMMTRLDKFVGDVMEKLEQSGIDDETIIMFTSDNGPHLEAGADPDFFNSNGPYRGYKRDLYEGGIRVPFFIRWPGHITPGRESDHVSAFWDIMPTLAAITGSEVPKNIDGISLLPTLVGAGNQDQHEYLYWEFHEQKGKQAVRKGNWKAVRLDVIDSSDSPIELYDLSVDPGEENNVAAQYPEIAREFKSIMVREHTNSEVFNALNHVGR